jgi:hypothetical protein
LPGLSYGVQEGKGHAVLTGDAGLGKTTPLSSVLNRFSTGLPRTLAVALEIRQDSLKPSIPPDTQYDGPLCSSLGLDEDLTPILRNNQNCVAEFLHSPKLGANNSTSGELSRSIQMFV